MRFATLPSSSRICPPHLQVYNSCVVPLEIPDPAMSTYLAVLRHSEILVSVVVTAVDETQLSYSKASVLDTCISVVQDNDARGLTERLYRRASIYLHEKVRRYWGGKRPQFR